jgi:hypothetical protein
MGRYFSFEKFITSSFVKVVYALGFLCFTVGGIALATWSGLRLRNASISRELGWRYVVIGVSALILGNIVWRVFCELWIVLFNMHAELVGIGRSLGTGMVQHPSAWRTKQIEPVVYDKRRDTVGEAVMPKQEYESSRQSSVLGLT